VKETSTDTWAYEAKEGDLIRFMGRMGIVLGNWDGAYNGDIKIFTSEGVESVRAIDQLTIYKLYDE